MIKVPWFAFQYLILVSLVEELKLEHIFSNICDIKSLPHRVIVHILFIVDETYKVNNFLWPNFVVQAQLHFIFLPLVIIIMNVSSRVHMIA